MLYLCLPQLVSFFQMVVIIQGIFHYRINLEKSTAIYIISCIIFIYVIRYHSRDFSEICEIFIKIVLTGTKLY